MIASFDRPDSQQVKDFWLRAYHSAGQDGSGRSRQTFSGWITAFCFWDEDGDLIDSISDEEIRWRECGITVDRKRLILDGTEYPLIYPNEILKGVVSVPVDVQDFHTGLEHKTSMIAGSVAMTVSAAGSGKDLTTVQSRSGWCMLQDSVKKMPGYSNMEQSHHPQIGDHQRY